MCHIRSSATEFPPLSHCCVLQQSQCPCSSTISNAWCCVAPKGPSCWSCPLFESGFARLYRTGFVHDSFDHWITSSRLLLHRYSRYRRFAGLVLSDTRIYEPQIRARLGTTARQMDKVSSHPANPANPLESPDPSPRTPNPKPDTPNHKP